MEQAERIGPTRARNWGWVVPLALAALLLVGGAADAAFRPGAGWRDVAIPVLLAVPFAAGAAWTWRAPPFEQCRLSEVPGGIEVAGRRDAITLRWAEIAAVTHRPSGIGQGFLTIERAADAGGAGVPPGVFFSVRATGERTEDVIAFLGRAADRAGYALEEAGAGQPRRAIHAFSGPRRWVLRRA